MLNSNRATTCHNNPLDDDVCVILVLGKFVGAMLINPALGMAYEMPEGTILVMWSRLLEHFNTSFSGIRYSVILTARAKVVADFQTP